VSAVALEVKHPECHLLVGLGLAPALVAPGRVRTCGPALREDRRRRVARGCSQRGSVGYARATPRF